MKENKYDDSIFFEKYSAFPRSVDGLNAAGEWWQLRQMLPAFEGRRMLDLGCGFGWHCAYAADNGAAYVLGTDISAKMLEEAEKRNPHPNVEYRLMAMEDMNIEPSSFDIVLSSLAIHYIEDFGELCRKVFDALSAGGSFVYSAEHPVFTAQGPQRWHEEDSEMENRRLHWPVDDYFKEGWRQAGFLGEQVKKYHRTITTHVTALLQAGFSITGLNEPYPSPDMLSQLPAMEDELRRPMMLIISATKPIQQI